MKRTLLFVVLVTFLFTISIAPVALADDTAVKDQIDQLQKQIDVLKAQVAQQQAQASKAKPPEAEKKEEKPAFLQLKPGDAVTFVTVHGGEESPPTFIRCIAAVQFEWQSSSVPQMPPLTTPPNAWW